MTNAPFHPNATIFTGPQAQAIYETVNAEFTPSYYELVDESHQHGAQRHESHFRLTLVCEAFVGLSLVQRHRQVYAALAVPLQSGVHALALHLYAPEQWQGETPTSPQCRGGSKV